MSRRFVLLFICAVSAAFTPKNDEPTQEDFLAWMKEFDKKYDSSEQQKQRFETWSANFLLVKNHNQGFERGTHSYSLSLNHFADMTKAEFHDEL
ncbi:hypothetical protein Ciccas_006383 [Cichlidogyrus casuarinus]|uniref:Cathepsin propeptide inhibitor domain-containing protein n=1 Tax=Cichlidogyrus casuarinus TaxID=1844966 RepID=A0ABD2Q5W9_9PLAT